MKNLLAITLCMLSSFLLNAQTKWFTKNGTIHFNATAPSSPDKIMATNKTVACLLENQSGSLQFSVLMTGFVFEKALMQEHFNENYVESEKFPKASFKGNIKDFQNINLKNKATIPVVVTGKLTLHGQTKDVEAKGNLTIEDGKIICSASFDIVLKDYQIAIPKLVADKIAPKASITVNCALNPL